MQFLKVCYLPFLHNIHFSLPNIPYTNLISKYFLLFINYIWDNYRTSSLLYIKFSSITIFNPFIIKLSIKYSSIIYYQKNNFFIFDSIYSSVIPLIIQQSNRNLHRIHIYRNTKSNILSINNIQSTMIISSSILTLIITFVTVYYYHSIQKTNKNNLYY